MRSTCKNRPSHRNSFRRSYLTRYSRLLHEAGTGLFGYRYHCRVQTPVSVKGWIYENACPEQVVPDYIAAGASALSILTDEKFFGGSLKDIRTARPLVNIPILRKDFIIDEYQLFQAKIVGADAILLIAAALEADQCHALAAKAHELGLEVLLEIHTAEELPFINKEIDMVGINNRNLGTFFTDVENSFRLAGQLPQDALLVSESGISDPETVKRLRKAGFRGFLSEKRL